MILKSSIREILQKFSVSSTMGIMFPEILFQKQSQISDAIQGDSFQFTRIISTKSLAASTYPFQEYV